jgi:hypothetical protein
MNKEVVVFKEDHLVDRMVEHGVLLKGMFIQVTPLFSPSTRVTISNVPPFIPNELTIGARVIVVWEVCKFN